MINITFIQKIADLSGFYIENRYERPVINRTEKDKNKYSESIFHLRKKDDKNTKKDIKELLKNVLRNKFKSYSPESSYMPFHTKLLGNDRMALYNFIHSLNTNFGTTIFEEVGVEMRDEIDNYFAKFK